MSRYPMLCAVLLGLSALVAEARPPKERYPKRDTIDIERTGIAVAILYEIPAGKEAGGLRRRFDRNGDGALDDKERSALSRHLARAMTETLSLALDGRTLELRERTALLTAAGNANDGLTLALDLEAKTAITVGEHQLRVADRHPDARVAVLVSTKLGPGISYRKRPPVVLTVGEGRAITLALRVAEP